MDNGDFMSGFMTGEANNRNNCGNGWGGFGGEGLWLFAIIALMNGGFGNFGNRGNGGNPVTEADLCNANSFSELKGSVGRLSDQLSNAYTGLQNGLCNLGYTTLQDFNSLEQLVSNCCCETKQIALENRYLAAQNTSAINATTVAENQKVLDAICGLRMEMKDDRNAQLLQRVNQLEMQQALCGIPRTTPYGYGIVPQFAGSCPNNWNNNI